MGQVMDEDWKVGQFGCCEKDASIGNLICVCLCAPCTMASSFNKSYTDCNCCDWCFFFLCTPTPGAYTLMRKGYHVQGSEWWDCAYTCLFSLCCIPQCHVANEVDNRGVRPYSLATRNASTSDWSNGFCDFFSDCLGCILGCYCPCIVYPMLNAEYAGVSCIYSCCCIPSALFRYDMRHEYNIDGSCCGDFCSVACFPGCAYVQMKSELREKGPAFAFE